MINTVRSLRLLCQHHISTKNQPVQREGVSKDTFDGHGVTLGTLEWCDDWTNNIEEAVISLPGDPVEQRLHFEKGVVAELKKKLWGDVPGADVERR